MRCYYTIRDRLTLVSFPYDDVFRTLTLECNDLVLYYLNEVFEETYSGRERIIRYGSEHFATFEGGAQQKRVTDSLIGVRTSGKIVKYHTECESSVNDNTILIRMFEYGSQIALDLGSVEDILEKKLYFLIPFYIFTMEDQLPEIESDERKIDKLEWLYEDIFARVESSVEITDYSKQMIMDLTNKVVFYWGCARRGQAADGNERS